MEEQVPQVCGPAISCLYQLVIIFHIIYIYIIHIIEDMEKHLSMQFFWVYVSKMFQHLDGPTKNLFSRVQLFSGIFVNKIMSLSQTKLDEHQYPNVSNFNMFNLVGNPREDDAESLRNPGDLVESGYNIYTIYIYIYFFFFEFQNQY